jgi:hypothetical protein
LAAAADSSPVSTPILTGMQEVTTQISIVFLLGN